MPVYGTSAATFNDDGVTALYQQLRELLSEKGMPVDEGVLPRVATRQSTRIATIVPASRVRYLAEISDTVRGYHEATERYAAAASRVQRLELVRGELAAAAAADDVDSAESAVEALLDHARTDVPTDVASALADWPSVVESYSGDEQVVKIRGKEIRNTLTRESLSGNKIPRVSLPRYRDHGELVSFLRRENLPGYYPFTAG